MKVELIHKVSEKERHIFIFNVNGHIEYAGYYVSRRNGIGDVWGDSWEKHFRKAEEALDESVKDMDFYMWPEVYDNSQEYQKYKKAREAFNPVLNKTKDGKPYLYGAFGPRKELKYPWNEIELKRKIATAMAKRVVTMSVSE